MMDEISKIALDIKSRQRSIGYYRNKINKLNHNEFITCVDLYKKVTGEDMRFEVKNIEGLKQFIIDDCTKRIQEIEKQIKEMGSKIIELASIG